MRKNDRIRIKKEKREKAPGRILDSLEGSVTDVEEELEASEGQQEAFDPYAPVTKNRKSFFVVGLLIIILAVVGLVTVIRAAVGFVNDMVNQTALKNEFASFLYPLVITDVPAFDSIDNIPPSVVVNSAIWQIIMKGDTEKYENDGTNMTVSEIDVESAAVTLFGYGVPIEHQTVRSGNNTFQYDESAKSYIVPLNPNYSSYWPRVSEISNVGETFTVTVEYMPPSMYVAEGMDYELLPDKVMIYTISRTSSSMTARSVSYGDSLYTNDDDV